MNRTKRISSERAERAAVPGSFPDILRHFIGRDQRAILRSACVGEERQWFIEKLATLATQIDAMPKPYATEGTHTSAADAIVHLHYFKGSADWFIVERDLDGVQLQAFGWADLGDGGELGYISISDLIEHGVELDLHWQPKTLRDATKGAL